jgi:hypothetical protein
MELEGLATSGSLASLEAFKEVLEKQQASTEGLKISAVTSQEGGSRGPLIRWMQRILSMG